MQTLSTVRNRFGSHYLQVGYHSRNPSWHMKQCHRFNGAYFKLN
jgi:DNA polymerase V